MYVLLVYESLLDKKKVTHLILCKNMKKYDHYLCMCYLFIEIIIVGSKMCFTDMSVSRITTEEGMLTCCLAISDDLV